MYLEGGLHTEINTDWVYGVRGSASGYKSNKGVKDGEFSKGYPCVHSAGDHGAGGAYAGRQKGGRRWMT